MAEPWTPGPLFVASMNDALFITNQPPSPNGTDVSPETPHVGLKVIAKVESGDGYQVDIANAERLAAVEDLYDALLMWQLFAAECEQRKVTVPLWASMLNERAVEMTEHALAKARGEAVPR